MPTWTIPAAAVTGSAIPTTFGNDVIGDLTILESAVGLYTAGPAIDGSPPPPGVSPNFLIAAGTTTQTTNSSGVMTYTWPTAFPTGLLSLSLTVGNQITVPSDNAQVTVIAISSGCTTKGVHGGSGGRCGRWRWLRARRDSAARSWSA
jgi:hypothetical protein